jgi:hypothetical protein
MRARDEIGFAPHRSRDTRLTKLAPIQLHRVSYEHYVGTIAGPSLLTHNRATCNYIPDITTNLVIPRFA